MYIQKKKSLFSYWLPTIKKLQFLLYYSRLSIGADKVIGPIRLLLSYLFSVA